MSVTSASYGIEFPDSLDTTPLGAAPYYYDNGERRAYASAQLIKALASLQLLISSLHPYLHTSMAESSHMTPYIGAIQVPTATTTIQASYIVLLQVEELSEVNLPRIPLSVQRVSASFLLREQGKLRLVGGSDVIAE